jgi:hypothetical protein
MRTTLSLSRRYLSLVLCELVVFNFRRSALINCALFSAISLSTVRDSAVRYQQQFFSAAEAISLLFRTRMAVCLPLN